jgi:hypothetical protein
MLVLVPVLLQQRKAIAPPLLMLHASAEARKLAA